MDGFKRRKKRIPKLAFSKLRNIGWHVSYRDPRTGLPKKHRFGMLPREEAELAYHQWVTAHLQGKNTQISKSARPAHRKLSFGVDPVPATVTESGNSLPCPPTDRPNTRAASGSLLHIASGLLRYEEGRVRKHGEEKREGSIHPEVLAQRKQYLMDFLEYLNDRNGRGAVGRMTLGDLSMSDVEEYNRAIVKAGYSASVVTKRLQVIKNLIDRAGRPEHGGQMLRWNWEARDILHGTRAKGRKLPTVGQLRGVLALCSAREQAIVWTAIGLGFGQNDLAALRVGQIDEKSYDLRRGKTGIERFGETPSMVWKQIGLYLKATPRPQGELMFVTSKGYPLVHGRTDAVQLWWDKLRRKSESLADLGGFYTLRHLGATEYGSRTGCSISAMKRWLGHGASSQMADVYMKAVGPENREVVEWVRSTLQLDQEPTPS
jgi:integrase